MPAHAPRDHDTGWVLKLSILATLALCGAEVLAGSYARSLAVVADAAHNLSDAAALMLTWFAFYLQARAPSERRTYGHHRAGVLAAFAAALCLLALVGVLFYEVYRRLVQAPEPRTSIMLVVGVASLAMNAAISGALRRAARRRPPPRGVLAHMAGDALAALGIIGVAVAIRVAGLRLLDPLLGALIAGLIVWTSWDIVSQSLNILLEGLPSGMHLDQVVASIQEVPGVEDVHDVHIWSLGPHSQALSCHIRIPNIPLAEGERILRAVNELLERQFEISHTTVQLEDAACDAANGCVMPASAPARSGHR